MGYETIGKTVVLSGVLKSVLERPVCGIYKGGEKIKTEAVKPPVLKIISGRGDWI
jgi:hypothetical protein